MSKPFVSFIHVLGLDGLRGLAILLVLEYVPAELNRRELIRLLGVQAMPYSDDLRERVIEAVEAGASRREVAMSLDLSTSLGVKWQHYGILFDTR
jgi:hypothetical protein